MRLLSVSAVKPGMKLATPVKNEKNKTLVNQGVALTERMIKRLTELNIRYVYIDDEISKGIEPVETVSFSVRRRATSTIESTFRDITKKNQRHGTIVVEKATKPFKGIISELLKSIKGNQDIVTLMNDVIVYDEYIFSHSFNVTLYSLAIGIELKLSSSELELLGLGAILHDVGKMTVPTEILLKPGRLTDEEFEEVKKHAESGFQILRNIHTVPLVAAHCAYQHHERLDGSGYPRGLKDKEIHMLAKIIAVADVFDAVTSNRVYRGAMLPHEGLEVLYSGSGQLFEKKVVDAFRKSVAVYPIGISVILNDGKKGIVSGYHKGLSERPILRIIEENGVQLSTPYSLDLKERKDLLIQKCGEDAS
ncbi:HD-GYP domain-containing protein [Bacillus litorisediminis]|uniref:HD-GYP domain-containing protein n=1 Tax=Bacillus litorisediminis TaxID=2922713 RepID=UPI001FAD04BD|nr:HD-GYP domain-containing protein [Bacillus litorisediminis]